MTSADLLVYLDQANFPSLSTGDFLSIAAAAGARAVDLHPFLTGEPWVSAVGSALRSSLVVSCVSPVPSWFEPFDAEGRFPAEVLRLLDAAGELGSRLGVPSPVCAGPPGRTEASKIGRALAALVEEADRRGARVAFEPVGESVRFPGKRGVVATVAAARELRDALGLPLELVADSYCLATAGTDLTAAWDAHDIAVVQIADRRTDGPGRVLPGIGTLPLDRWLGATKLPPGSAIGIEVFPLTRPDDPLDLASELVQVATRAAALGGMRSP
ncbi:MAG: sugar phosphate isomerase/epimerase family protein [Jatrophihabitantaceae bacterium]